MPAPPARHRSANVPCGIKSTSSSPESNCRSNSAFSPTYDEIIFFTCRVLSNRPIPKSSTPALLEIQVSPFTPFFKIAAMQFSGMPLRPKPPSMSVALSGMSFTASSASFTTLLIMTFCFLCFAEFELTFLRPFLSAWLIVQRHQTYDLLLQIGEDRLLVTRHKFLY